MGGVGWIIRDSTGSLIGGGCPQIGKYWKIKVLEMKAIEEFDYAEAITSLCEIDSDLSNIKSVSSNVLKLAKDFGEHPLC